MAHPVDVLAVRTSAGVSISAPAGNRPRLVLRNASDPDVSPDGRHLAFVRADAAGTRQVFVSTTDGRAVRQVTRDSTDAADPDWSPDGRTLAYTQASSSSVPAIATVRVDGAQAAQTLPATVGGRRPAWSPNGSTIAYEDRTGVNLTDELGLAKVPIAPNRYDPAWAPDGKALAVQFLDDNGAGNGIEVRELDSGSIRTIVRTLTRDFYSEPAWSSDGTRLYVVATVISQDDFDPNVERYHRSGALDTSWSTVQGADQPSASRT